MPQVERGLQALMGCVDCDGITALEVTKSGYLKATFANGNEQYIDQSITVNVDNVSEDQNPDNALNNICAGVKNLVDRMLGDVLFSLDQAQFTIDQAKLASDTAAAILNTIFFASPFSVESIYDPWSDWIFDAVDLGISGLKLAYSDPAVREAWEVALYCGVVATGTNVLTKAIYEESVTDLPLLESQSSLLARLFQGLESSVSDGSFSKAKKWYNLGALNEDNSCEVAFGCAPTDWITTFDVGTNNVPYTPIYGTVQVFGSTNALTKTGAPNDPENPTSGHRVSYTASFTSPTFVNHVKLQWMARTTGVSVGAARNPGFSVWDGGVNIGGGGFASTEQNTFQSFEFDIEPGIYSTLEIRAQTGTASGQQQTMRIDDIEYQGL